MVVSGLALVTISSFLKLMVSPYVTPLIQG